MVSNRKRTLSAGDRHRLKVLTESLNNRISWLPASSEQPPYPEISELLKRADGSVHLRICRSCTKVFMAEHASKKYCSGACKEAAQLRPPRDRAEYMRHYRSLPQVKKRVTPRKKR